MEKIVLKLVKFFIFIALLVSLRIISNFTPPELIITIIFNEDMLKFLLKYMSPYEIVDIVFRLFAFTIVAFLIMRKILNKSDIKHIKQLKEGTKEKKYTSDVIYQKLYIYLIRIPF